MERAKLVMRRAMGRLNIAFRQAQSNHMLYLILFAFLMFTVLYVLGKVRSPCTRTDQTRGVTAVTKSPLTRKGAYVILFMLLCRCTASVEL